MAAVWPTTLSRRSRHIIIADYNTQNATTTLHLLLRLRGGVPIRMLAPARATAVCGRHCIKRALRIDNGPRTRAVCWTGYLYYTLLIQHRAHLEIWRASADQRKQCKSTAIHSFASTAARLDQRSSARNSASSAAKVGRSLAL